MLLLASLLYMCHIMNDIAKNLGINLAPLGSVYNTPKGVTSHYFLASAADDLKINVYCAVDDS